MEISKDFLCTFDFKQDQVDGELKLLASRKIPVIEYDIDEIIEDAAVLKNIMELKK